MSSLLGLQRIVELAQAWALKNVELHRLVLTPSLTGVRPIYGTLWKKSSM